MLRPSSELLQTVLLRSGEHILLVGTAIAAAVLIALPLGLWIHRHPRWAAPVLSLANGIQTIPSLAIFGLLLTVPLLGGIGRTPAIVALTLYALLPILRGTLTGMEQVPAGLKEAGLALGLSPAQVLRHVELPLALPTLMAGLRVATVISVGVATVAAAIGAGGLGVFIFRGIATVDNEQILAGALPAALLALAADRGLGALEGRLSGGWRRGTRQRQQESRRRRLGRCGGGVLALAGLAAVIAHGLLTTPAAGTVRIGSKAFTEQLILGELLAQQIEATTDLRVRRDFGLGGTFVCHQAVRSGRIDGYVEYTGTAWTAILEQPAPDGSDAGVAETAAGEVFTGARRLYRRRFGLTMFPSLGFENTFAILIRGSDARSLGIGTISDAAAHTPAWQAGFSHEFMTREDGFQGLAAHYGLTFAATPQAMDLGLTYRALAEGRVDLIAGDSTNGLIASLDLAQLQDDRRYFPPYEAVPVFNSASLSRHPQLGRAVEALSGTLTAETMRQLNAAVDLNRRPVEEVVREWRKSMASSSRAGGGVPHRLRDAASGDGAQ